MRRMYDSINANNIPTNAEMVAGYIDGEFAWSQSDWDRFPNAVKVRIAVNPATNDGHVLDVESGNWDATASVQWTVNRYAAGIIPTIYCNRSQAGYSWADVINAHLNAEVMPPVIWIAWPDYNGSILAGCIAIQCLYFSGYDVSKVADYWPSVDVDVPTISDARKYANDANTRIDYAIQSLNLAKESLQF